MSKNELVLKNKPIINYNRLKFASTLFFQQGACMYCLDVEFLNIYFTQYYYVAHVKTVNETVYDENSVTLFNSSI